jgi:aspartyl/asparaginyl beta-hydroxylase (cupin superfamily)
MNFPHRPEINLLAENWEIIASEMKSIKTSFPDVKRPRMSLKFLKDDIVDEMANCEGWSRIDGCDGKWWNFPLVSSTKTTGPAKKITPKTVEILEKIGGVYFSGFSAILPHGFIDPHTDTPSCTDDIGVMTYHVGLDCPDHCYLIQGDIAHKEENGKLFSFNCTMKHSAVNMSNSVRVILFVTFLN